MENETTHPKEMIGWRSSLAVLIAAFLVGLLCTKGELLLATAYTVRILALPMLGAVINGLFNIKRRGGFLFSFHRFFCYFGGVWIVLWLILIFPKTT